MPRPFPTITTSATTFTPSCWARPWCIRARCVGVGPDDRGLDAAQDSQARSGLPQVGPPTRACGSWTWDAAGAASRCTPRSTTGSTSSGVTLSVEQAALARKRAADAGLTDRVDIRVQDYRDVEDGPFDAISSIGMSEHVGREQIQHYSSRAARACSGPGGRLLNHAISWNAGAPHRTPTPSFPAMSSRTARCSASRRWSRRSNRPAWRSWTLRRCGATMP